MKGPGISRSSADRVHFDRRVFLSGIAGLGSLPWLGGAPKLGFSDQNGFPAEASARLGEAFTVRLAAAQRTRSLGSAEPRVNGDEALLPDRIACYSKGLPHDRLGHVDPDAYEVLLRALDTGRREDFESIPLGGFVHLANPQAALSYSLVGPDGCQLEVWPPPRFSSAGTAAEMVELYWRALARDVPFAQYSSHPLIGQAAKELSGIAAYAGPREGERVTAGTIFRGTTPGELNGPLVSQFLWKAIPLDPMRVEQKIRTAAPGLDYLTEYEDWLDLQRGEVAGVNRFDAEPRYIRNGRDLGEYVHRDFTYQASLGACLTALDIGTPPDGANPYKHSHTQSGFATFGPAYLVYVLAVVAQAALKVCWYQKWKVHRRLRPEKLAGRIENHVRCRREYPLPPSVLGSAALEEVRSRNGTGLLPQAYPEGSPTHPSFPAGHAVIAGACVTALKACFDETHEIPDPVVARPDGLELEAYEGPPLTIGGELDKLASNIAHGRDFAGVHFRSDSNEGLKLGEAVAIAVLNELRLTGNELFTGYSLKRFDGTRVSVG